GRLARWGGGGGGGPGLAGGAAARGLWVLRLLGWFPARGLRRGCQGQPRSPSLTTGADAAPGQRRRVGSGYQIRIERVRPVGREGVVGVVRRIPVRIPPGIVRAPRVDPPPVPADRSCRVVGRIDRRPGQGEG